MRHLQAGTLAVDLRIGVGEVQQDVLNRATPSLDDDAYAFLLHLLQLVAVDLKVPREVVLAALQHGAGSAGRIAAPFEFNAVEEGTILEMVIGVDLRKHQIIRPELDDL